MKALGGVLLSVALLTAAGCAQMRPSEATRPSSAPAAAEPAGPSPIQRGEQPPPLPEQTPPLPPDAGQSNFPTL